MKHYIAESGSILPLISTLLFIGMFLLVLVYILTDRRRHHHERMRSLALGDDHEQGDRS